MAASGVEAVQKVALIAEPAPVDVALEPKALVAAAQKIATALEVKDPVADVPPIKSEKSQLPALEQRTSTPGPEQPAMYKTFPKNEVENEPVAEAPEPEPVEKIAEVTPAATKIVADAPARISEDELDDVESFSDIPESPDEAAEEPARSSPVGAPITAQAVAAMSRSVAQEGVEQYHSPTSDIPETPAEAPEVPARSSPVAPALTAQAAPSTSRSVAQAATEPEICEDSEDEEQDNELPAAPVETAAGHGDSPAIGSVAAASPKSVSLKELPKVAAGAAAQAGQAYVDAGKQARVTLKDLLSLRDKEGPPVTLTLDQIATAAFLVLAASQLLILPLFMPSTFRLLYSLLWGLSVGFGLSFLFYYNRKRKAEVNELLATNLGLKGVQMVAAGIPAVFNVSDEEKMEWLNTLIAEVWPYVDKGACQMIKDVTAQVMPGVLAGLPGILAGKVKSVGFKHLTFGAAPVRVESISVKNHDKESLVLELSVKWCGDPNITLAIEIPGGQKLCPRVLDISFAAKVRVVLRPLVARLPGFVAAMATVPKPPLIKYRLDFGKALGGSLAPMAVTPVVNYFLKGVLDRMLVWPNRIVVPILQETAQDAAEVQKLMRRMRGMVRVCVVSGKQLKGVTPTEQALMDLTTDSEYYESTQPRSAVTPEELSAVDGKLEKLANTEIITWEDTMHLLVQEPESQMLRLEAFEVVASRSGKNVVASNRRSVGRALVKLGRVCKAGMEGATEPLPMRVQLGEGEWGSPGGPGKGAGTVVLRMSYFPCEEFTKEQVLGTAKGIVTVRLLALGGLTPSSTGLVTAYASFNTTAGKKEGKASWRAAKKYWTLAGHVSQLKARIAKLELDRVRDVREGEAAAAEAKAAEMRKLQAEIDGSADKNKVTDRRVTLDYSMETVALTAFYRVTEKVEEGGGGGEDNCIVIKVVQEGRVKRNTETLGVAEVPVSKIKNGYCVNPLSGKKEYGLYLPKWRGYDPDQPGSNPPESEWGFPVEGSAGVKVWAVLRWVPCIEAVPQELDEEDEAAFVNALPSMIKPVQSAWQVK